MGFRKNPLAPSARTVAGSVISSDPVITSTGIVDVRADACRRVSAPSEHERLQCIAREHHSVAALLQRAAQRLRNHGIVIGDQDPVIRH
jgi:hypothetical protein